MKRRKWMMRSKWMKRRKWMKMRKRKNRTIKQKTNHKDVNISTDYQH